MSNNIRVVFNNLVDDSQITGTSGNYAPELPARNLAVQGRTRLARTTNTSEMAFTVDFTDEYICNTAAIVRHNLTPNGQWRVRLYSGHNAGGSVVYDSAFIGSLSYGANKFLIGNQYSYHYFTNTAARSARINISDSSNPDGFLQVSRAVIGQYSTTKVNTNFGAQVGWEENTRQTRTTGGSLRSELLTPYRTLSGTLNELSEDEREFWQSGSQYVGKRRDFLVSLYPEAGGQREMDNTILGKFTRAPQFQHWTYETFRVKLDIAES
jgi:hypothetical protein